MEDTLSLEAKTTATKLLEKRRKMYEIKEQFDRAKEEEQERFLEFEANETKIRADDEQLQQGLTQFHQILQDNDMKRAKAKKRYEEESRLKRQKEEKIEQLKLKIEKQTIKTKTLALQVARMKKYEDYLEKVRERNPDDFTDISDIVNRFTTLSHSFKDLTKRREHYDKVIKEIRKERDTYEKEKNDEQLALNIEIAKLQKKLEDDQNLTTKLEEENDKASSSATQKDMELGRMLTSIENLYHMCKTEERRIRHDRDIEKAEENIDLNDFNQRAKQAILKLSAMRNYIIDLRYIIEDENSREILSKHGKSSKIRASDQTYS